jgi:hypothetical protein
MNLQVYNPGNTVINALQSWGITGCPSASAPVVAMHVLYNHPTRWPGIQFQRECPQVYQLNVSDYQHVLLTAAENYSITDIEDWASQQNFQNYSIALGARPTQGWQDTEHCFYRPYWLPHFFARNHQLEISTIDPPFVFDALLGARRLHRDFVMQHLQQSKLLDHSIVTYLDCFPGGDNTADINFTWPYVSPNLDPNWEVAPKINNLISFETPWQIYHRTRYSIVCESLSDGSGFFLTEKTMKVLWAQRVFVMFGVQYFLRNLKQLGFQTFDCIVDETYDSIADPGQRWQAAWQSAQQLADLDPVRVRELAQPIVTHNHQRLIQLEKEMQACTSQRLAVIAQSLV